MQTPDMLLGERAYDPEHIEEVLVAIADRFTEYFASFCPTTQMAKDAFEEALSEWRHEQPDYDQFLNPDSLEEYEDDPNSFKGAVRSKCPIIRRSLNSQAEEMKKYKVAFSRATGRNLLHVTRNIVRFGNDHMAEFDDASHENAESVDNLMLDELLEEDYIAYGVIGGGIKSHFLYSLYPNAFPNRSRLAVWALYFLSGKCDFGFSDGSEFLMIDVDDDHCSTQQNYHYPYNLFAFYSLKVYVRLKEACAARGIRFQDRFRYVYLDTFLNHIAETHKDEIRTLKGTPEESHVD